MGSEFATVITAIDNRGYCVCKVASLGKLSTDIFYDFLHDYFDSPASLCSDANNIYEDYCQVANTPHCAHPSNFLKIIGNKDTKLFMQIMTLKNELTRRFWNAFTMKV